MTKIKQTDQSLRQQVLNPCLLGRPIHLLPAFASQLREDFLEAFRMSGGGRYWASFQVDEVAIARAEAVPGAERWIAFAATAGTIVFAVERGVLLSVLNYRYGRRDDKTAAAPIQPNLPVRVTATEERLAVTLGQQLASVVVARIEHNLAGSAESLASASKSQAAQYLKASLTFLPPKGGWMISVTVRDIVTNEQGKLWFGLDNLLMTSVLRGLTSTRDKSKTALENTPPLSSRLQVKLTGRLIRQEVVLGDLLDIRVGDVIPVNVGRADVLLENSRLFTAAVTENKGKLCLTSFEDAQ